MNEEILKKINFDETINEALPKIIEAFVSFYGEHNRELIVEKFNNMLLIGYCQPEDFFSQIETTEVLKLRELMNEFIKKINIKNIDKETLKKIFIDDAPENTCITSLESYIDYKNGNKESLNDTLTFLNKIYKDVTKENIDTLIENNFFKDLDELIPIHYEYMEIFKNFILSTKEYKLYLKKCKQLREELSKKYLKKIILELKDKIDYSDYIKIEREYNLILESYTNKAIECKEVYLSKELLPTSFEYFTKETDEIINSISDYRKEDIQNARILYFKKLGINLGENYKDYIKNEEVLKLLPNQESVMILSKVRKRLYIEMRDEYYKSLPEYITNREKINKLELLDKDDGYDTLSYEENQTMIVPNIKLIDNIYKIFNLVLIYLDNDDGFIDSYIIHELNHILEVYLLNFDGTNYKMTSGWEIFTGSILDLPNIREAYLKESEPKREYELFNEIINELISQEITEILFESNDYIFNTKETAEYQGTNYELTRFLVDEFYQTYKKEIIESRHHGNIDIIYNTVGKENFDALNKLFNTFYRIFPEDTICDVYIAKEKGLETEQTKLYDDLCIKRDNILSNMKKYHQQKTKKLSV